MGIDDIENVLSEPAYRLEEPIMVKDLIQKCSNFTIRSMDEDEIERNEEMDITQVYSFDELEPYCLPDVLEPASDDDPTYDELSKSFPIFRKKMKNVTEDGKVMKLIDKEGVGECVPATDKIVAYVHYAAYVELTENPFDVSRLRQKKPVPMKLGVGEVIPGLETAIRSMRKGEKAKFLLHPDVAFKEVGVPPRIPPQATILFDVELVDICEYTGIEEFNSKERTFEQSFELAYNLRVRGNKLKKLEKNVNAAITSYKKALQILIEANHDNDYDEKRRNAEMLHLYCNLSVCYLVKKCYPKVVSLFRDARTDCGRSAETCVKLLYCCGKAQRMLCSFDEALEKLRRANRLQPGDDFILKELCELNQKKKDYQEAETRFSRNALGFKKFHEEEDEKNDKIMEEVIKNVGSEFKEEILRTLEIFEASVKQSERLNGCEFTYAEKEFIRKICRQKNYVHRITADKSIVIIKKAI